MDIMKIWVSQRKLRCVTQISEMIKTLHDGGCLPPITLSRCEDGEVQLKDGHHRLTAFWLSGRKRLECHEYLLIETDSYRPRFGKMPDLLQRVENQG